MSLTNWSLLTFFFVSISAIDCFVFFCCCRCGLNMLASSLLCIDLITNWDQKNSHKINEKTGVSHTTNNRTNIEHKKYIQIIFHLLWRNQWNHTVSAYDIRMWWRSEDIFLNSTGMVPKLFAFQNKWSDSNV